MSNNPVCDFLCEYFVGILEELTGKILTGEELACIATGAPSCIFQFNSIEE